MPFSVDLLESERGWGQKIDDTVYFHYRENAENFVKEFNSTNTETKTPDWYMIALKPKEIHAIPSGKKARDMKKIYVVLRNADFTEGRGPMLFHAAFTSGEEAIKYVANQFGIFGSAQHVERNKYNHYAYANGYQIDEVVLHDNAEAIEENERRIAKDKALAKLTKEEQQLLGLIK